MSPLLAFLSEPTLLFIALVALLLFGHRLPTLMRSLGQGVSEFKKGIAGIDEDETKKDPPPKIDSSRPATLDSARPANEEKSSTEQRAST